MTRTDDLIARLAAEAPPQRFIPRRIAVQAFVSMFLPVAAFLLVAGFRDNLTVAWMNPMVPLKTLLPLLLCILSLLTLLRLARPGTGAGAIGWSLLLPAAAAAALWLGAFLLRAPAERFAEVGPASVGECLGAILLLSIIPAAVMTQMLRQGAATSPSLSGALVGLAAATGVATGYSLFCTQDNPLFFITWYGFAFFIVTLAGAAVGGRLLRW